eukprot:3040675-Pyramimonas_sp.AAC.1
MLTSARVDKARTPPQLGIGLLVLVLLCCYCYCWDCCLRCCCFGRLWKPSGAVERGPEGNRFLKRKLSALPPIQSESLSGDPRARRGPPEAETSREPP